MEPKRCHLHGLVAAEDGRCVICRRAEGEAAAATGGVPTTTYLAVILGVLVVSGLALAGYKVATDEGEAASPPVFAENAEPASEPEPVADEQEPAAKPRSPHPRRTPKRPPPQPRQDGPVLIEIGDAPDEKLIAAMQQVEVIMYRTPECNYCDLGRRWASENGYRLVERDIDKSETDRVLLRAINPSEKVPTFDVQGEVLIGWNQNRLEEALVSAAEKKLDES